MKTACLTSLFTLAAGVAARPGRGQGQSEVDCDGNPVYANDFPMTTIAGIEVVDTQIVRDAIELIKTFDPQLYNHQVRSWLFGAAEISNNATLKSQVDIEVQALGTLLHDLGWDMTPGSPWVSSDRRFEIDGAIGATKFIKENAPAEEWPLDRLELVFDGIALHGTLSISEFKRIEVANVVRGIGMDFAGPHPGLTDEQVNGILAEYPNEGFGPFTNDTFIWFCQTKPNGTYDTWIQDWGVAFVDGYSPVGHRLFDRINPPPEQ